MSKYLMALIFVALCPVSQALAADWEFVGTWRMEVKCREFGHINTLRIKEATASKVRGTTNVDDGYGRIVGGSFDGKKVEFTNKYRMDGRSYTEIWTATLSKNGRYLRGSFTTTNETAGGCTFKGPKV